MALRILHIAPYYLPDVVFGGPVFSVSSLCEALSKTGSKVTVYTVGYGPAGDYPLHTDVNGVEVVYFKGNAGSPCQVSFQLWEALNQNCRTFDVVHLHTWWNILIFRCLDILKKHGVPAVLSPRGMMSDYSFSHRKTVLKKVFHHRAGIKLLSDASLHATSDAEAADMAMRMRRPQESIFTMPNLLNLKPEAEYRPVDGSFTLGFLSRLHHKKGIETLLEAVAEVPEVSRLVIGGGGEPAYEQYLRDLIQRLGITDKVHFAGWIKDADKPAFFRQFQVFALPSFNENFANVVAEAWAAGKPVLVSTEVGLSNYVEEYRLGWICKPEKSSVVAAIRQAAQEQNLWADMGNSAIRLVRERFSDEHIVQEYDAMYRRMLSSKTTATAPGNATKPDIYILGINAHHADASAALLKNGELIAAVEEERIRRVKHWAGFPSESIRFCLDEAGIRLQDLDHIAISRSPTAKWMKKLMFMLRHPGALSFAVRGRLNNAKAATSIENSLRKLYPSGQQEPFKPKIAYVEHHRSHLASAFFASGFDEAALLSVDGSGDFTTTMMGVGKGCRIEVLDSIDFPHSLGIFYTAFTQLLGFPHYGDEYKVMGLAPYGQPVYYEELKQVMTWHDDGSFSLNSAWFRPPAKGYVTYDDYHRPVIPQLFTERMEAAFGKARKPEEPLTQHHKDLAASVQKMLEETMFHLLKHLHRTTGLTKLCLSGGVAQNSVANGKIIRNTPFTEVYVPPAGHDAGLAIGAAMYLHHHVGKHPRTRGMRHAYTGNRYSNEAIEAMLKTYAFPYHFEPDNQKLMETTAACIASGGVIGWFRGRSEFGPRALGNRSILADPRRADAKELLNLKIKRRENFRPFAPSVAEEFAGDYFEYYEPAPFMEKVFPIKKEMQSVIPAVTHADGSGRLQTVSRENNPDYHALIETFGKLTGVAVLLNTSFNENEPIVHSPKEALACFERTKMDMLVLENYIITRPPSA